MRIQREKETGEGQRRENKHMVGLLFEWMEKSEVNPSYEKQNKNNNLSCRKYLENEDVKETIISCWDQNRKKTEFYF